MIRIFKKDRRVIANIEIPSSKSITNRALIISALCKGNFKIENASESTDSEILKNVLQSGSSEINVHDAGTAFRFLTSYLSTVKGDFFLTGSKRLCSRPISPLVKVLRDLGADIEYGNEEGRAPLKIYGKKLNGGTVQIDSSISSQFVSSLLMVAPTFQNGLTIILNGEAVSMPYIQMTLEMMKYFGALSEVSSNSISVKQQNYQPQDLIVESDWSCASFWYEIAALSSEATIILKGLKNNSIQGDSIIAGICKCFGVNSEINGDGIKISKGINFHLPEIFEYNFKDCPDLVMPVAAICAGLKIKSRFYGVKNLRIKESDRLLALQTELAKTGIAVILNDDDLILENGINKSNTKFHSHNDHRIAMALAPLALMNDEVFIDNPDVVKKSYPQFWDHLKIAGFEISLSES